MSTEILDFEYKLKQLIDWHMDDDVLEDGDCGCADEDRREWQDRMKVIGPQAYRDHVHQKVCELVNDHRGIS